MQAGRNPRRAVLKGAAATALLVSAGLNPAAARRRGQAPVASPPAPDPIADLARRFIESERRKVFSVAGEAIRSGMSQTDLLGAIFLAGVQEVQPRPVGFKLHCVMMVGSTLQMAAALPPEQRWLGAFFNLDDFKNSQRRDVEEGDWHLGPRPATQPRPAEAVSADLAAALASRDATAADEAITAAAGILTAEDLFEVVWPVAAGDFENLSHKIIHAAQMYRTLKQVGWQNAEPALRSLIYGLLSGDDPGTTADGKANLQKASQFPQGWQNGRKEEQASLELLSLLRTCSSSEASEAVVGLLRRGVAPESIWDGLRLVASEMLLRKPSLLPVHPLTSINSLHFAYTLTTRESTRRLALLQAAAFQPLYRENLARRIDLTMTGPGVDAGPAPKVPDDTELRALRNRVFASGRESHQFKYAAAVIEEGALCAPVWAGRILRAGEGYLPRADAQDTEVARRARVVLAELGITA